MQHTEGETMFLMLAVQSQMCWSVRDPSCLLSQRQGKHGGSTLRLYLGGKQAQQNSFLVSLFTLNTFHDSVTFAKLLLSLCPTRLSRSSPRRGAGRDVRGDGAPDSGCSSDSSRQEAAIHRQAGGGTAAPARTLKHRLSRHLCSPKKIEIPLII